MLSNRPILQVFICTFLSAIVLAALASPISLGVVYVIVKYKIDDPYQTIILYAFAIPWFFIAQWIYKIISKKIIRE